MALLAEELVEEWLNRQGFFTIRGVKLGVHEIDLLAMRPTNQGLECRHVEVHVSVRPIGYIAGIPRAAGGPALAKARDQKQVEEAVREWIKKKFDHPEKNRLRQELAPGRPWSRELVVHILRYESEADVFRKNGIIIHRLANIVSVLKREQLMLEAAAGSHLVDLVALGGEKQGDA
jgi:hypothetical protein